MTSKLWSVMNDLEVTTTKVVSAREIIESAVNALENHKYNTAETLMNAAYEYLEYYLNEFDDKFKDAWQEVIVKPQKIDSLTNPWGHTCGVGDTSDYCKESWFDFWDNYYPGEPNYSYIEDVKYDGKNPWSNSKDDTIGDGFCMPPEKDKVKKWQLPVEVDSANGEYYVCFPDDLLEAANLKEGVQVEWIDQGDGSYLLKKVDKNPSWVEGNKLSKTKSYDEMIADGWTMTDDGFWIKE